MVHINQVGLTHFKSFGGAMTIPLEEGFTVVTGPNGSGKSNILDGVLFCLGLATSRGMRADRLPDLVNSGMLKAGKAAETSVSVRFDLSDWSPDAAEEGLDAPAEGPWIQPGQTEWTVTRKLRVMPGGSYSSSYSADGVSCNLQQLQTQLRRIRIDPEGSNVVMQGDVTRIVSMSNRDRRGLIDELAGVALFDTRIEQTRRKLDDVQERQERCRIIEQELLTSRQRLEKDCAKARQYQELRERLQLGRRQEMVLAFEAAQQALKDLATRQQALEAQEQRDAAAIASGREQLNKAVAELELLQEQVKALGEDQLLAVQAELAGLDTSSRELERQATLHQDEGQKLQGQRHDLATRRQQWQLQSRELERDPNQDALNAAEDNCKAAEASVEMSRRRLADVAGRSGAWVEEQKRRSGRRHELQSSVAPLLEEQQQLQERLRQERERLEELTEEQQQDGSDGAAVQQQLETLEETWQTLLQAIADGKQELQQTADSLAIQQRTRSRLEQEQTRLEREIARLESRRDALQESRGTGALRLLLEAGLDGIHGPVAQLGEVEDRHRLALEVAAGARLGQVVVDDDRIAARAIELLKSRRAGRLTFLPLNKIRSPGGGGSAAFARGSRPGGQSSAGLIGRAVELVRFEPVYDQVFAYVFGDTQVFSDLASARQQLGRSRAVTLDGELLEKSGAMTGGSFSQRSSSLSFGRSSDQDEAEPLRRRLLELGESLVACRREESKLAQLMEQQKPQLRQLEQQQAALIAERNAARRNHGPLLERSRQRAERLSKLQQDQTEQQQRLEAISRELAPLTSELKALDEAEQNSGNNDDAAAWAQLQKEQESSDQRLETARSERDQLLNARRERQLAIERLGDQEKALAAEEARLQEAVKALASAHGAWRQQQSDLQQKRQQLEQQQSELQERFGSQRRARDAAEAEVGRQRQALQQAEWNLERLKEDREGLIEEQRSGAVRLQEMEQALPDPRPEIPEALRLSGLEALQADLHAIQQRMEALEPVNMLALEELEALEQRLNELNERLDVLNSEREELLLRIETVATLRQDAFMEAFTAVDGHFREIFASLSDGDGHLQLENPDDPLEGGLTLVAHPKGKTVRRLASMSGGEKSLTALSFLFALQRFRPSPFYALDEVDSFLDGVNVERLAALIARQAEAAQFMVVSHRRPMIGAAQRTIGVTQARGAHTQVVGLPDAA
ncbi:chromosome segregation protein SMC [Synechococcus sp. HB1133]|uniref:chromosome segregation protein SMC n=1 Tax=unclassified Synechococcus TaxID=2626047 RepID=UPI00140CE25A|nr:MULTISPECIES: chromosome segregation protein SMC [unclassified Synechococcus]MCB4393451.1 chromosome segregation protein SMC [Synechococcus sp. PH41509]MCB4423218.1 chromosome segregation protein SMC [Synechococcus sp. HB1133]MCB4430706.1 chromosome segregation protein SMC [Synechococcus sp. HBA1120]NHI82166.1 chromosome segregation protein SMC [Synechococcus sp. HB1133]